MGKPKRETLRHKEAFEFYYGLGQERSLERVARQFGVSNVAAENWSRSFNWLPRIVERDREIGERLAESTKTDVERLKERQLKVLRAVQSQYVRNLAGGESRISAKDFLTAAQMEARLLGLDVGGVSEQDVEELFASLILAIQSEVPDACPACQARLAVKERLVERFERLAEEYALPPDAGSKPEGSGPEPKPA